MVLWTHASLLPNGNSISLAIFAGLTVVTNMPSDHVISPVATAHIHAMHAMQTNRIVGGNANHGKVKY